METEKIKNGMQSKQYKKIVTIVCVIVLILIVFNLGMRVGYMKASFTNFANENLYRPIAPEMKRHAPGFTKDTATGAHGATGIIFAINLPTITIADQDGSEKIIRIGDETILRSDRKTITANDLRVGNAIIVIGEPNGDAEVEARLLRVIVIR